MSIDLYREKFSEFPPAMFAQKDALKNWAKEMEFRIKPVGDILESEAMYIWDEKSRIYEAVWVAVASQRYRDAMVWHAKTFETTDEAIETLDADHVINSANIKDIHKDAWLMLMPVGKSSNRSFGSAIEKKLLKLSPHVTTVNIGPVQLLKLFLVAPPKNEAEMELKLKEIAGQMVDGLEKDHLLQLARAEYKKTRDW